jgi:hypothetical protein
LHNPIVSSIQPATILLKHANVSITQDRISFRIRLCTKQVFTMHYSACYEIPTSLCAQCTHTAVTVQKAIHLMSFISCFVGKDTNITVDKHHYIFTMARQPLGDLGRLIFRGFTITHLLDTPHSIGLLWMSEQPVAETSTSQNTEVGI